MVGRPGKYQPRYVAGELDCYLQSNTDEAVYFKGAALMQNAKPMPQGGFTRLWGTLKLGRARNKLGAIVPISASAPFGNAENILDGDLTTYLTSAALSGLTTVATVDLGSVQAVSCVDLENFGANLSGGAFPTIAAPSPPLSPPIGGTVSVATSADGVVWTPLDNSVACPDTLTTRRFAMIAGSSVQARFIAVNVNATPGGDVVFNLCNLRVWQETAQLSTVRIRSFTHSRSLAYDVVFTDQNAEIYGSSGRLASIATTLTTLSLADVADATLNSMVATMKNAQQLDTMLVAHQGLQPLRIMRQGADTEWNADPAPFQNIPNYDFGAGYANGVAAQWQIEFFNFDSSLSANFPLPAGGAHYTISVNGVATPAIQQPSNGTSADFSGTAAAIQAALLALPGISAGLTVTRVGATGGTFLITFSGAGNQGDGWAVSGTCVDKGDAAISAAHVTVGVIGGEPIMSASRGWPGSACFYEQRTAIAGFAGLPNAVLVSESGNPWELNTKLVANTAPMLIPLDTDGAATIVSVHQGRSLDFFCDAGEYWFASPPLDRAVTPTVPRATNVGISPLVDPFENEGKTYFVAKKGGAIFEFVFNYALQNYEANNVSIDSSSLVKNIVDGSLRRLTGSTDLNEYYCVRADGTAIMMSLLRQQEINSFCRRVTDGKFLCVNVNDRFEVTFGVSRQVNGQTVQFIERAAETVYLDCQSSVAIAANAATISGLADHIGATVYAIVDNYVQGPFTVDATGTITLAFPALANGTALVGRWTPLLVSTLPQPKDVAPRTVVERPARVHTVRATVVATSNIAISANDELIHSAPDADGLVEILGVTPGDGPYDAIAPLFGGPTDTPLLTNPYSGRIVVEGLQGFTEDAIVTFTQTLPGPLTVTGVTIEVDL
jgi:hypothetical protein